MIRQSYVMYFLITAFLSIIATNSQYTFQQECKPPPNEVCEYWWYVHTKISMEYNYEHLTWNETNHRFYDKSNKPVNVCDFLQFSLATTFFIARQILEKYFCRVNLDHFNELDSIGCLRL